MLRASAAIIAGMIVVGVLAMLIMASQSVNETYYADFADRVRAVEASRDDISAFLVAARASIADGRPVPDAATAALDSLVARNAMLQARDADAGSPVADAAASYEAELASFLADGRSLLERQNELAAALRLVQEESPEIVKELRRSDLRAQSQNAFVLALDIIEFASGQSETDPQVLSQRLTALAEDDRVRSRIPRLIGDFAEAADIVLGQRQSIAVALETLTATGAVSALDGLADAMATVNRLRVTRAERARTLLYACTLVLLAGVAYVAYRLQSSYRALNRSNAELAAMNDSLEERVQTRTEELSLAYEELKESQVQLVQAEKMSSLGELVAGISHEINTPLWYLTNNATIIDERLQSAGRFAEVADAMIEALALGEGEPRKILSTGLTEMRRLLQDGLKEDIGEASELVRDSVEGLEELSELAQSLKDFSRLDRAQTGSFNVNDGLERTLLIVRNKLKDRITVNQELGEVPSINCSPSQVNQVFLNLITNAADAIDGQGEITIRTWGHADGVSVSIADTGCGIAPDDLGKIRDPFYTTKEVGKGTGLGLSIVDRIVSDHGGELDIRSEPGNGTTITVTLPMGGAVHEADGDAESDALAAQVDVEESFDLGAFDEERPRVATL
jgi:signal transduction histidine kinase